MRVLWDFRLFSYAYAHRGVGTYVRSTARMILQYGFRHELYIWGNPNDIPHEFARKATGIIPFSKGSWKTDIIRIPLIILKYNIDIFHYWMALGPVFKIGMSCFHPCKTIATVYDLGVEKLTEDPFCKHVSNTHYWKIQKRFIRLINMVFCISENTKAELCASTHLPPDRAYVQYMPMGNAHTSLRKRNPYFVTLAGAPHKNLQAVIYAFLSFVKRHPNYSLVICGDTTDAERSFCTHPAIEIYPMNEYHEHLDKGAGLICCSLYEGLSLPPIEAMAHGCPVIVSDIPAHHETCENAASFVDPQNTNSIADGMRSLADNQILWQEKATTGYYAYCKKTISCRSVLNRIYGLTQQNTDS